MSSSLKVAEKEAKMLPQPFVESLGFFLTTQLTSRQVGRGHQLTPDLFVYSPQIFGFKKIRNGGVDL